MSKKRKEKEIHRRERKVKTLCVLAELVPSFSAVNLLILLRHNRHRNGF